MAVLGGEVKSVSIVIPCTESRRTQLYFTLASIVRQHYPGKLEIIVVEDVKPDFPFLPGSIKQLCIEYGAQYWQYRRTEYKPDFQNPGRVRNLGLSKATGEILMTQDCEIVHESPRVIEDLVNFVGDDRKLLATACLRSLNQKNEFDGWYNHPGPPKYGIMGGCLAAIHRETVLAMGGFEESFFGYGYEDNFYIWLLSKNGVRADYVNTMTAHQWHPRSAADGFTGNANRALAWTLVAEIEWEGRPPKANYQAPTATNVVESYDTVAALIRDALTIFHNDAYQAWAENWLSGKNTSHDYTFEARDIASAIRTDAPDNIAIPAYVAMKAAEAAWAIRWAALCYEESVKFRGTDIIWSRRLLVCHHHHLALARVAIRTGKRVLAGELPRA